ncbi:MAG: glycosyltransferase [Polyangiaceae bacterium]
MRIVHVVHSLDMGGQERLILHLTRELYARGHHVAVVSLSPGGTLRSDFGPIQVHDAPRKDGPDPALSFRLARLFKRLGADVVHTHNPSPFFPSVPAARLVGVKRLVHTKHGANIYGMRSLFTARILVRALSALVAVSEGTAEVARKKERVPERLLHVIPNGIPLRDFEPNPTSRARVRKELGIPEDAYVVGTVGRLAVEKNYPLLVRAMTPLLGPKVRLVLVGEGAARGEIEASIAPEVREWVVLTGVKKDVPALLSSFDVFTLTSKTEGLPLAVPEAMACELPIVTTAVGGLPNVVTPDVGLLAPSGDERALTDAYRLLHDDVMKRKAMARRARERALDTYSLETMVDAYEALYRGDPRG